MTTVVSLAAPTAVAMIAIFVAALIFALQHVGERYSPALSHGLLRRYFYCAAVLFALVVATAAVAFAPVALFTARLELALLLAAVCVGLVGSYVVWSTSTDPRHVLTLLGKLPLHLRTQALCDVTWNAVQHADVVSAEAAMSHVNDVGFERSTFLEWIMRHHVLLDSEWFPRTVLDAVLAKPLDDSSAHELSPILERMLVHALDRTAFDTAKEIVSGVMNALASAPVFTNAHANLLFEVAFACWNIGESGASKPRSAPIPNQLEGVQAIFMSRLRDVVHRVLERGNTSQVEELSWVLEYLLYETEEAGGSRWFMSRVYDLMSDGHERRALSPQVLHNLANGLGVLRMSAQEHDDEYLLEWIDRLVDELASMLRRLGGSEGDVAHLLANGGFNSRMPRPAPLMRRIGIQLRRFRSSPWRS